MRIINKLKYWLQKALFWDLLIGLTLTGKQLFACKITIQYPEECTPKSARFRGLHALRKYPNAAEKCVACKLCEAICPALAITIESQIRATDQTRKASKFTIDLSKCMYCGLCEEVCPVDAIVETYCSSYHFAEKKSHLLSKEKLLAIGEQYEADIIRDKDIS